MEAKRLYNGSDAIMIEKIRTISGMFEKYQADFVAYDATLDTSYLTNWKNADPGDADIESDSLEVAEEGTLRDVSLSALEKCRVKYREVKYFAGKAFPYNKEALKEFGEGQFSRLRNSPLRMVQFMQSLHGVATKYKTELIAKGYSQADIDAIATLTDELRNDNNAQQLKKKERPTETRKRIEAHNAFYSFGQLVADAAANIFAGNSAMLGAFRLALRHARGKSKQTFKLAAGAVRKLTMPKTAGKFTVRLTNHGTAAVAYWQGDSIRSGLTPKQTLKGAQSAVVEEQFPAKKFLIVQNTSSGDVKVTWNKEKKEE